MTQNFADKETRKLFEARRSKVVSEPARRRAQVRLARLDRVESVEELEVSPGKGLQKLGGDREGRWTISVDAQHRICSRFDEEASDAYDIAEAADYY